MLYETNKLKVAKRAKYFQGTSLFNFFMLLLVESLPEKLHETDKMKVAKRAKYFQGFFVRSPILIS